MNTVAGLGSELEGITVVAIEQAVAAPYCGLLLADAGARLIKVERPGGDVARAYDGAANGESSYFVWLNGGKESVVLDIDTDADADLLHRLVRKADIFLHNLGPGSLERRGFSGEKLREANPGLITCEITGYGRTGPYADMKAYDLLVQAEAGLCAVTGGPDMPARVGVSMCDIATGLTAFSALLRALILRGRTGTGIDLSIAMFDVVADWMNVPLLFQRYLGKAPSRLGLTHPTLSPYGVYEAAGGEPLMIAVQSNREWEVLCHKVLDRPDLARHPQLVSNMDRVRNRALMDPAINAVFSTIPRHDLLEKLKATKIACSTLNDVEGLLNHPHLRERISGFADLEVRLADLPVAGNASRGGHAPRLDEHGAAIRAEFATG